MRKQAGERGGFGAQVVTPPDAPLPLAGDKAATLPPAVNGHGDGRLPAGNARGLRLKRAVDLVGGGTLVLLLSPLFAVIAAAIKLDSRGPVIFRQQRVGARRTPDGWQIRRFEVLKFRTMYHGADQSLHEEYIRQFLNGTARPSGKDGATFKLTEDPRVTRVGRLLRRTSLDELPQLVNVLRGEMSLVGPRPVPVYEFEGYGAYEKQRLQAIPGITGLWQVRGRGRVTFEEMIRMDIEYVRDRSFWLDLKLLALTVPAALSGRGAE